MELDQSLSPTAIVEETDESFRPTGVEAELNNDEHAIVRPYDPELIRVDPKLFSLRQILDMIDDGDLELAPDFQRLKVWTQTQRSRLIESILLRIPLPAFYFSSDKAGKFQIVDGLQRLSAVHDFVRGGKEGKSKFPLTGLEYLKDRLENMQIDGIQDKVWHRRIDNTQITANVIDPQTPHRVKYDIFKRINTGGTPLNAQEIRHCLSKAPSRNFLKKLTSDKMFQLATGNALNGNLRMVDREVVLRFCGFERHPGLIKYREFETMDEFLNAATLWLDECSQEERDTLEFDFLRAMKNAWMLFGEHAFRKWGGLQRLCPFNRALFEAWSVVLSKKEWGDIDHNKSIILEKARMLMSIDSEFISAISSSTGSPRRVEIRFSKVKNLLESSLV